MKRSDSQVISSAIAGMSRFFSEGMCDWSKSDFLKLLHNDSELLNSAGLEMELRALERGGFIRIVGSDYVYIKVLKHI